MLRRDFVVDATNKQTNKQTNKEGLWVGLEFVVTPHHRVQNGSGAHPASYLMGTRGSFWDNSWVPLH